MEKSNSQSMSYKNFYLAIRHYAKKRITREEFMIDWRDAQHEQGIETKEWDGKIWQKN
jgi:hypothetical protein